MSRSGTPIGNNPAVAGRKRKDATVFIERKRPRSSDGKQQTPQPDEVAHQDAAERKFPLQDQEKPGPGFAASQNEEKPRKKPGLAARSSTPPVRSSSPSKPLAAPIQNVRLPSGVMMPWDVASDRLAAEMQAYTLEEIGRTLARQEAESAAEASRVAALREKSAPSPFHKSPSKFKPKKPALRYAERHPEQKIEKENEAMDVDEPHIEDEDMDDGEYIIDTYVRIPADALETEEQSKNFGLLVLDTQPDIDEFYREEEDSDEEDDDEEEDENGIPALPHPFLPFRMLTHCQRRTTTQQTTRTKKSPQTTSTTGMHITTARATPPISKNTMTLKTKTWYIAMTRERARDTHGKRSRG